MRSPNFCPFRLQQFLDGFALSMGGVVSASGSLANEPLKETR